MKKITAVLIVFYILCSTFMPPNFIQAIEQHEAIDGTTFGSFTLPLLDLRDDGGIYRDIWANDSYVFAACYYDGIQAYSFDGSSFALLGDQDDGDRYMGVWGDDSYVFAACYGSGIRAYSFDGTTFNLLATQDDGGSYLDIWADDSYIFVAGGADVKAYSFNGISFTLLDEHGAGGNYEGVWGNDSYIYTACGDAGIRAYSFDGSSFNLLATQDDGSWYRDGWGNETYTYVSCQDAGIRAYSFDGSSFNLLTTQDDGGNYYDAWGNDTYVYTANGYDGIRSYSFDGAAFTLLDSQDEHLTGGPADGIWGNGNYIYAAYKEEGIGCYLKNEKLVVTRDVTGLTESNQIAVNPTINRTNATFKIPVSSDVQGILDVTNNTAGGQATEVNNTAELVNDTFWYDSTNQMVYIKTINLTTLTLINWTVNCSHGVIFNLIIPSYLEVGQYFHSEGFISDSNGTAISGMIAETRLLFQNGTDALTVNPKHNCTNGNYHCTFSTSILIPGIYSVSIEFTDPNSGIKFKEGSTLYLSVDPGPGVHVSTFLHFTFYNSNTRIGMPSESFKIYASTDATVDLTDRIYVDLFGVYTGQTIYYRVDDFFDNQIYPTSGEYESLEITSIDQFEDVPITWYDLSIKNLNQTIMHFSMENSSRYYNSTLFPMDTVHINVLPGGYNITLEFYSTINGSLLETVTDTISISGDAFYIATGYNAMVHVSWYNTNEGLGIPDETLKLYFNDQRQTSQTYWTYINQTIKITVKDYYNFTLFEGNFTITSLYRFLDFGLTFHEYDFTNANDEYFYASFLKDGATRWYEKVVSSGGQKAFMLPSGNYTVRVYNADNSTYLSWTDTVNRSKAYLIGTDGVSLIIQGQSVIVGQFLELREEFAYAFMPDVTIISRNPPMIFSIYDKEGMAFGNDFYMICPPLITIATTRVTQYGNWINSTPMIPGNGSVANGTVTIIRDTLYISGPGSIAWVNITYTANGSVFGNTSYIPSRIDIYGENLTINASGDILVLRETKFNQVRKFDWTYYPFAGYGPDPDRAGWHTAGIEAINSMPVPLYEVYVIAGFSDESNPDGSSVVVSDTTNGGVILERGPGYDVTDTSVHFNLLGGMSALDTRAFTIGYYKMQQESYIYDEGTVSIPTYDITVWNGGSYNTFPVHWTNPYDRTFRGALYIKLNFDVPTGIDTTSMRIYDLTNDHELDSTAFIPGDKYIRISAEGMGDVLPGGSRKFDVYFLMEEYAGADPKELHLNTQIFWGITPFLLILLAGIGCIIVGIALLAWDKKNKDRWKVCVALGIFIIVIIYILNMMGM